MFRGPRSPGATPSDRPTRTLLCGRPTPQHPRPRSQNRVRIEPRTSRTLLLSLYTVCSTSTSALTYASGNRLWYAAATHHIDSLRTRYRPPSHAIQFCQPGRDTSGPDPCGGPPPSQSVRCHSDVAAGASRPFRSSRRLYVQGWPKQTLWLTAIPPFTASCYTHLSTAIQSSHLEAFHLRTRILSSFVEPIRYQTTFYLPLRELSVIMRMNYQCSYRNNRHVKFDHSQVNLNEWGKWQLIRPVVEKGFMSYSIWHNSSPLLQLSNTYTNQVVEVITDEVQKWLDPLGMDPLVIPPQHALEGDSLDVQRCQTTLQDAQLRSLQLVFNHAITLSQAYAIIHKCKSPCFCVWGGDTVRSYPEPDLADLFRPDVHSASRNQAILAILRYPGLYDGGAESMIERTIRPAIRLLFKPHLSGCTPSIYQGLDSLSVISESAELTDDVRTAMAENAYPILQKLQEAYGNEKSLPTHGFVYGIHTSRTYVTIFAHFPLSADAAGYGGLGFCQVLLSRFYILHMPSSNTQDDLFLSRWRLFGALSAVIRHTEILQGMISMPCSSHTGPVLGMQRRTVPRSVNTNRTIGNQWRKRLAHLRTFWNAERFSLPTSWIPPDPLHIKLKHSSLGFDKSVYLPHQLGSLLFQQIREKMLPLDDDYLLQSHMSGSNDGPDFLHPSHGPNGSFSVWSYIADKAVVNTLQHYSRTRDFLAMAPCYWEDVNVFLANIFAGFSAYSVQWNPVTRYPFPVPDFNSEICTIDFALAARFIPPTTRLMVDRSRSLPLTISSPAVFLGTRSTRLEESGRSVSQKELSELSRAMEPHLNLLRLRRHYSDIRISPHTPPLDKEPTLFCTYLKKGFVHILAFAFPNSRTSVPDAHLLDSLPLELHCDADEDLVDRMRVALALFTLQRQVVRVCDSWSSICWPTDILADEHEAIVEVTGVCSPAPSVGVPPRDSPLWDRYDCSDDSIGDDPKYIKRCIRDSVARVTAWLDELDSPDNNCL